MASGADRGRGSRRSRPGAGRFSALAALCLLALSPLGCSEPPSRPAPEPYDAEAHRARVEEWRQWRHDDLERPDGWLSLAGLYWLRAGDNTLGGGPGDDLLVPRLGEEKRLGVFAVADDRVDFVPDPEAEVTVEGAPFAGGAVWTDAEGADPAVLEHGSYSWFVIRRDGRLGVRLRDSASPVRTSFTGMAYFPLTSEWRIDGHFDPYDPPRTIQIPNVLGTVGDEPSEGAAVFELDGVEYRIDLWRDSDDPANFFTAFGDATNGGATYGGGRFLWIDAPDEHGRLVIDFNRAYNPPCVFTPFATCPLPPPQNRLELSVEAGELAFEAAAE